jgi:diguanylate cyclase (GGDEF)-like protein/hemerythrin-like metal-binding protein
MMTKQAVMNNSSPTSSFGEETLIRVSDLLSILMLQTSGARVSFKAPDGSYQLVNEALAGLFGKSVQQIVGLHDRDLFPAPIVTQLESSDRQILAGAEGTSDELYISIDGVSERFRWVKFPVMGADATILSIGSVLLDIEQHDTIAQLKQSLQQVQQTNRELNQAVVKLDLLAATDILTGAWNRRRLEETASSEMDRLKRYEHPLSLLMIDIDFFKKVNDQYGHDVGDLVLAELAALVKNTLRRADSLTRWGGEEFVVLCPNTTLSTMAILAERVREKVAQACFPAVKNITVSIGGAECVNGETWEQWLKRADAALYRAKAGGRNQVQLAPEVPKRVGIGENLAANFVHLSWHAAYECGNPVIDGQHQALFGHSNELMTGLLSARPADEISILIDKLIDAVVEHFTDEEVIISAAGFPGAAAHATIHRGLVDNAIKLVNRFHGGTLAVGELFQFLARDLVARHLLGADREFFPYLSAGRQSERSSQ